MNWASLGTNERDFVLKVVSLEDCEILVESIKAQRQDDDQKKKQKNKEIKKNEASLRNSSEHYWENIVNF